jgi:sulfide:quinone oxidoreductase
MIPVSHPRAFVQFLAESGLTNEGGFIPADPFTLRALKLEHVFVMGDNAAITLPSGKPHPKAGFFALAHSEAVAGSIAALVAARASGGDAAAPVHQSGKAACTLEVSGGVAKVEVDLLQPQPVFVMKPLDGMTGAAKMAEFDEVLVRWFDLPHHA